MAKNILIIGGSYFVGKVFVELLLEKGGFNIYIVNRGNAPLNHQGVTEIVCDRHDYNLKESIPDLSYDVVVDFCAYSALDIAQLMIALSERSVNQFIFISTVSVYEDSLDLPVREDWPKLTGPQPGLGPAADYGYNKWQAELKLTDLCKKSGMAFTVLRPVIIYGKYNYAPRESYFFDLILKNEMIVLPTNNLPLFQFVSVWDVAELIYLCLGHEAVLNRAFNLAGEELISYERLIEVMREITGSSFNTQLMENKEIDEQRIPLPFPLDRHLVYSGTLISRLTGFSYTSFVDGMRKTWEWYKKTKEENF